MLPYIEQGNIIQGTVSLAVPVIDPKNLIVPFGSVPLGQGGSVNIKTYMCPSAPTRSLDYGPYFNSVGIPIPGACPLGVTDYAATMGIEDAFRTGCAPLSPSGNVGALGVMAGDGQGQLAVGGGLTSGKIKITDVTDGTSNTLLYSEDAGRHQVYAFSTPLMPNNFGPSSTSPGYSLNAAWADNSTYIRVQAWGADGRTKNGCNAIGASNNSSFYSFHTGGVNSVRCDGSVSFMPNSTAPAVVAALVTKQGGEVFNDN